MACPRLEWQGSARAQLKEKTEISPMHAGQENSEHNENRFELMRRKMRSTFPAETLLSEMFLAMRSASRTLAEKEKRDGEMSIEIREIAKGRIEAEINRGIEIIYRSRNSLQHVADQQRPRLFFFSKKKECLL